MQESYQGGGYFPAPAPVNIYVGESSYLPRFSSKFMPCSGLKADKKLPSVAVTSVSMSYLVSNIVSWPV